MQPQQDPIAEAIVKAIAYTENRGKPNPNKLVAGKTGELPSVFQFTPDTWKHDAQTFLGDANTPISPDAEAYVMYQKVSKQLADGRAPEQILSMHNAGSGEPNAWKGTFKSGKPSKGVNQKYNVPYDVPGYVNMGMKYFKEFSAGDSKAQKSPEAEKAIATIQQLTQKYSQPTQTQQKPQTPNAAAPTGGLMQQAAPKQPQPTV